MRIAQVAPLHESVPPKLYGGTERIVSYLTEELVRQGHDVTLFASGDSDTRARLIPSCRRALRLDPDCRDTIPHHVLQLEQVLDHRGEFDIVHFHTDYLHFPICRREQFPHVTTLHGRLDQLDVAALFTEFAELPLVSISDRQRQPLPWVNWQATVHHGLPDYLYSFRDEPGQYLAFVGRTSPEKQPDIAIDIAVQAGIPLKLAAKIDPVNQGYFDSVIKPRLNHLLVEFVGEIGDDRKNEFIGNAYALVFPINWPEPFGLVMIEALACGTPVIAYHAGAVPEVIADGQSGFIVDNVAQAVWAVQHLTPRHRRLAREQFESRFTVERMAADYLGVYERQLVGVSERAAG